MKAYLVRIFLCLLTCALVGGLAAARTIEFETTEVTAADVTLSADGQWLIFTMLGHLFRLPVEGGTAEQLTFGPYYDTDPLFSPDGTQVAFVSDRDASEDNIFVLELATGQITQLTHEPWAGRPTWTPDGRAIVYLLFARARAWCPTGEALVRRISLSGGKPETLSAPPRVIRSVFYLPDGRLAWTVLERPVPHVRQNNTRIEVVSAQGTVSTLRTLEGIADRIVASPTGDGLYCRRRLPLESPRRQPEELLFLPLPGGAARQVIALSGATCVFRAPRLAVAADNKSAYLGQAGRLWKIALPRGTREPIAFTAKVRLEIQDPLPPPKWALDALGSSAAPRSILDPRLSPDGRSLVFGAAGYLWQQRLDGGPAQRLFAGSAFEWAPALSPDGKQLAFVRGDYGKEELSVFDFETQQSRTLASGDLYRQLSWSRDGQRLVFGEWRREVWAYRAAAVNLANGKKEKLADVGRWRPRPHFSADGQLLYFSANPTGTGIGALYRLPLNGKEKVKPEPVTQLARHLSDAVVSPNGKWLTFRRNSEIWVAPLGDEAVREADVRRLSTEGGRTFAFTPDGAAVIYAAGNRVWRHPLGGGEREEIPIRLELQRPTPPPVLVRRVRMLDFAAGSFGPETSLYIEQGRIRWTGPERGRRVPPETVTIDAGGRYAIPGLFDMHMHGGSYGGPKQEALLAYGVTSVRDLGA